MKTMVSIVVLGVVADGCGGNEGEPPVIERIAWTQAAGCTTNVRSNVSVTVTVSDPDTPAASLTISGSASGCTGAITNTTGTLSCPQLAPYAGSVRVRDPEGHEATRSFTINPCADGSVS